MTEELKAASVVYVRAEYVRCPHCDAKVEGWWCDPRSKETTCDECEKPFVVAADSEVRLS